MKLLALSMTLLLSCGPALADLEINQASQADLERLRGVGPQLSTRILTARALRAFPAGHLAEPPPSAGGQSRGECRHHRFPSSLG